MRVQPQQLCIIATVYNNGFKNISGLVIDSKEILRFFCLDFYELILFNILYDLYRSLFVCLFILFHLFVCIWIWYEYVALTTNYYY